MLLGNIAHKVWCQHSIVFLFSKTVLSRLDVQYTLQSKCSPMYNRFREVGNNGGSYLLAVPFISMPLKSNYKYISAIWSLQMSW